jgi:hypothetical protein
MVPRDPLTVMEPLERTRTDEWSSSICSVRTASRASPVSGSERHQEEMPRLRTVSADLGWFAESAKILE